LYPSIFAFLITFFAQSLNIANKNLTPFSLLWLCGSSRAKILRATFQSSFAFFIAESAAGQEVVCV